MKGLFVGDDARECIRGEDGGEACEGRIGCRITGKRGTEGFDTNMVSDLYVGGGGKQWGSLTFETPLSTTTPQIKDDT